MRDFICIRCSIIWKFEKIFVSLPAVTTDLGAFGCQSSMKWKDQRYGMDGDSPVIGWGDPEGWGALKRSVIFECIQPKVV